MRLTQRVLGLGELAALEPGPATPDVHDADRAQRAQPVSLAHRRVPHAERLVAIGEPEYTAGDDRPEARVGGDERPVGEDGERKFRALLSGAARQRPVPGRDRAQHLAADTGLDT